MSSSLTYDQINWLTEIFFDKNKKFKKIEEELYLFSIDDDDFFFNINNINYEKILNFLKENNIEFNLQKSVEKIKQYILTNYENIDNTSVIVVPLEIFIPEEELFYLKLKCK